MTMRDLVEQRGRVVAQMRELSDNPSGEGGDLSDDQEQCFETLKGELGRIEKRIERQAVVDDAERRMAAPTVLNNGRGDGRFEERARESSITKTLPALIGEDVDTGFEREISAEVKRRTGRAFRGIAVPDQVFQDKRVLTVGGGAADLYPTVYRPELFIDRLRSALVVGRLGASVLDGLMGENDIPKQTASSTAQWVGEDGEITATDASFTDVTLSPKTVGAITSYSRRTLINVSPSIEQIVRNDLAAVIVNAIDLQALTGDGQSNRPLGVIDQSDVHAATLAGPTWAQVLAFISSIQSADAEIGAMGWTINSHAVAKLRSTLKVSGDAGAGWLMDTPGMMAGYNVAPTTALPGEAVASPQVAATVIFGAWSRPQTCRRPRPRTTSSSWSGPAMPGARASDSRSARTAGRATGGLSSGSTSGR